MHPPKSSHPRGLLRPVAVFFWSETKRPENRSSGEYEYDSIGFKIYPTCRSSDFYRDLNVWKETVEMGLSRENPSSVKHNASTMMTMMTTMKM